VNNTRRYPPAPPVGSFILLGLMYLPWLWSFFFSRTTPGEDEGWEFPGSLIVAFFTLVYTILAITLSIYLGRRSSASKPHAIAFFASLGILALIAFSILKHP
jgi:hypothetical protein